MPDADRVLRMAAVQVSHLTREELDIRAADPRALHVDHDLAGAGLGRRDVLHLRTVRTRDDERPHRGAADPDHKWRAMPWTPGRKVNRSAR
jgi:hypothetical protein